MRNTPANNEQAAMWGSLVFGIVMVTSSLAFALAPKEGDKVAVITLPWSGEHSALHVIADAKARIVSPGRVGWIAIASDTEPKLNARLYQAGATIVINAAMVIACGATVSQP